MEAILIASNPTNWENWVNPFYRVSQEKVCFRSFQRLKHRWERLTKTHKSVSFYFRQWESSKQLSFIFNRCPARNTLKISKAHFFLRHPVVTRVSTVEHLLSAFNPTNLENWVNHLLELSFQYSISTN